jgi:GT2 family glycosyltransferase
MKLVVLGMHRSGTSALTGLLNLMGAYFGSEEESTGANEQNPKGFWERQDVRLLNDDLLQSIDCDWNRVGTFSLQRLSPGKIEEFNVRATKLLAKLNTHESWVIKEPRLCLLLPLWQPIIGDCVCVHIYRNPLEVSRSLQVRDGTPVSVGIALWEKYTREALYTSNGQVNLFVSHRKLMTQPQIVARELAEQLSDLGNDGLMIPPIEDIEELIDSTLYRERDLDDDCEQFLNLQQYQLFKSLVDGSLIQHCLSREVSLGTRLVLQEFEDESYIKRAELDITIDELHQKMARKQVIVEGMSGQVSRLKLELSQNREKCGNALNELDSMQEQLVNTRREIVRLKEELANTREEKGRLTQESKVIQERLQRELLKARNEMESQHHDFKALKKQASAWQREANTLHGLMVRVVRGTKAMAGSNSWKIGSKLVSAKQKLLLRKSGPSAIHYVSDAISDYESWKKRRTEDERLQSESSYSQVSLSSRPVLQRFPTIDIVVCVHNALEDVTCCLNSIIENTPQEYTLYVVNDGSDEETTEFLRDFCSRYPATVLLENEQAGGYTKAANRGMRACSSEYVVCLNSDTLVPRLWLSSIVECGESDPSIGIVGPLSNAASWQSVPERFDDSGDWAVNELCNGLDVNQMAELVYEVSEKRFPRVDFVNGFCFAVKGAVFDAIGYLDEEAFPEGYGEENDYCLRAADAGFRLAIADQGYVYHSKSKSYSHDKRRVLSKKGGAALKKKHGSDRINRGVEELKNNQELHQVRARIRQYIKDGVLERGKRPASLSILYVMPVRGGGGGAHSVIQEVTGMRALGINAKVATLKKYREGFQRAYPAFFEAGEYFLFFADENDLYKASEGFDIIVATLWSSPALIKPIAERNRHLLTAYYIQDYEPWFFEKGSNDWRGAYESYTCVEDMCLFAKTDWLCQIVEKKHQRKVRKVSPSLDNSVYFPSSSSDANSEVVTVCAMIRPSTPRRAPWTTLKILKAVKAGNPDKVRIVTFGCEKEQLEEFRLVQAPDLALDFEFQHEGFLVREQVAELLRGSDIFVDFSDYQAFGRTGLEAMACGCSVILPEKGGVHEYAIDQFNAVTVDTKSEQNMERALANLIADHQLRRRLQKNGLDTVRNYSIERAVLSKLSLFRLAMAERDIRAHKERGLFEISEKNPVSIAIWPCVMRISNEPTGSAYIRLLEPLRSKSIAARVKLSIVDNVAQLQNELADICIVQRNAIKDESAVNSLFEYCQDRQVKVIHEIDDDLFNLEENGQAVLDDEELRALKLVAAKADAVITSTPSLQQLLKMLNANVFCIQNALSGELWCGDRVKPDPAVGGPVRFLYMGTRTHTRDLGIIADAWRRVEEKYAGRATLDIIGGADIDDLEFGNAIEIPPSLAYPEFVQWLKKQGPWDIGLIPLRDTGFNRKKSHIKFLDYSALSLAIVCSDIITYRDIALDEENALLVNNSSDEWYAAMERLIDDKALRLSLGEAAYSGLIENYRLEHRARDWLDTFRNVVNG